MTPTSSTTNHVTDHVTSTKTINDFQQIDVLARICQEHSTVTRYVGYRF